mgnify:CR=1 FL=1
MPKLKTHKGLSKRVKVTKKGKIKRMLVHEYDDAEFSVKLMTTYRQFRTK